MKKYYLVFFSLVLIFGFILEATVSVNAQETKAKEKMKFLVIADYKDIYYALPENERKQITDETTNYVKKAINAGTIMEMYSIPGWNRNVSIEQYDSLEALYNHFSENPIYPYIKFEIYPLQEGEIQTDVAEVAKPDAKKMKFLVINEAKDIWYAMSADEREKIEEANPTKVSDFLKFYSIPGWNRSVSIEQYDSIESLYNHFEADTYYPYANFEVYPLKKEVFE